MNKLFTKIGVAFIGMAMAIGVGVAIGGRAQAREAKAAGGESIGDEITAIANIRDGYSYKIVYTASSTDYYLTTSKDASNYGSVTTTAADAGVFTFTSTGSSNQWLMSFDNNGTPTYYKPGSSNGTVSTSTNSSGYTITAATHSNKIGLKVTVSSNDWYIMKNNSSTRCGGYKGTQTDITKMIVVDTGSTTKYTLTYDAGANGTHDGKTTKAFEVIENTSATVKAPAAVGITPNEGYIFNNWTDGTSNNIKPGDSYAMGTSNHTLTAQWVAGVGLSYDKNGGTGSMDTTYVVSGGTQTVASCSFTAPNGKQFAHWNTKNDDSGTPYNPNATIENFTSAVILYAIWEDLPTYTRIFSADQLWNGQKVLLAYDTSYIAKAYDGSANNVKSQSVTVSSNSITNIGNGCVYTLGQVVYEENSAIKTAWTIYGGGYYLYSAGTTNNNYLKGKTTLDEDCYWTITYSDSNVVIKSVNNTYKPDLRFNNNSNQWLFSCYNNTQQAVTFYVKDTNSDGASSAKAFVDTYMHMDKNVTGQCNTYYPIAKAAWNSFLTSTAKAKVASDYDGEGEAFDRLTDWAAAKGDILNGSNELVAKSIAHNMPFSNVSSNSATTIIVIVSLMSFVALGGFFMLKKKKEQ